MRFFCEYCGNRIDAEKDPKCPNCGASYKRNKSFIELEKNKREQQQMVQENAQKVFKHVFGVFKFSWIIFIMPIIIFVIVIAVAISITTNKSKTENKFQDNLNDVEGFFENLGKENQDTSQENIIVGIDEFAQTKEYKVKVTKYEKVEDTFKRLENGYEYIKFHLLVENISGNELTKEDVNCIVDGIAQTNKLSSGYSDLPMFINKDLTVKGTATFEVPKDAASYDIKYGDYILIHIEK